MTKDKAIGIIVAIIGIVWLLLSYQIEGNAYSTIIGPDLFPKLASGGMILCGIGLIIRKRKGEHTPFLDKEGWIRVAKITIAIAVYPFIMTYLGFIVAAVVLVFTATTLFDVKKSLSIAKRGMFAVATSAVLYLFFSYVLDVILPSGKLFGLF